MTDFTLEDTVHFKFTTRSFSTGAPDTLAGTPVLSIYEDDSITQITAGITLIVDFDAITGLNLASIVASAVNGYESGKQYGIVVTTGSVGGVPVVGEVVGQFTLEKSAAAVDLANATDGLGAIKAETAVILVDTAEIGVAGAGLTNIDLPNQTMDITGNLSGSVGSVTADVGITQAGADKTWLTTIRTLTAATNITSDASAITMSSAGVIGTVNLNNTTTTNTDMRGTDGANTVTPPTSAQITDDVWNELQSGHTTVGTFGKFLDVEVSSVSGGGGLTQQNVRDAMKLTPTAGVPDAGSVDEHLDDILADTSELQIDWVDGGRLDLILDSRMAEASINTTSGAIDNVTLVATTTTSTDQRGTDNALLASNAPTNFSSTVISATGDVNSDTNKINGTTVLGNGTSANLWRGS